MTGCARRLNHDRFQVLTDSRLKIVEPKFAAGKRLPMVKEHGGGRLKMKFGARVRTLPKIGLWNAGFHKASSDRGEVRPAGNSYVNRFPGFFTSRVCDVHMNTKRNGSSSLFSFRPLSLLVVLRLVGQLSVC
jgi:hypothetical protein